jgi:hypothetical protein
MALHSLTCSRPRVVVSHVGESLTAPRTPQRHKTRAWKSNLPSRNPQDSRHFFPCSASITTTHLQSSRFNFIVHSLIHSCHDIRQHVPSSVLRIPRRRGKQPKEIPLQPGGTRRRPHRMRGSRQDQQYHRHSSQN